VNNNKKLNILGIRGIPANHGGFETFAEAYSLYLVDRGWDITVYCQEEGKGKVYESIWNNINRVHIPVSKEGPLGTIIFDFKCVIHSLKKPGLILSLGYNTAIFNILFPLFKRPNIINMDGIEWKRGKWGKLAKLWFRINEWIGCKVGDHLIADNPEIKTHLSRIKSPDHITMIPYSAELVTSAKQENIQQYGLKLKEYSILIARPEKENSILEIVKYYFLVLFMIQKSFLH